MTSEPQVRDPGRSLSVDALCASYGEAEILHDVSLSVAPGEVVSLLGPSGCGKTTLLRCIAGLERPTGGVVSVAGAPISGPSVWTPPERRGIGMVFQDGALFPHLNVIKNVAFGLPKSERSGTRPDEMLELVGLEGLGERMPTQLSGGQQQRVALARALAPAPKVLLLDEPFSGLDVALRVTLRVEVRSLLREIGVTAVFVTHDQDEAFVMGDRVAVLRAGILEQHGTPSELYLTPASPWVGKFVGDANVISGDAGASYAETGIGRVPIVSSLTGPVDVLVRPENLTVSPGGDAVVETIEYYGHDTRYGIRVGDTKVAVRVTGEPVHESGAKVSIGHDGIAAMAWPQPT